MSDDLRIFEDTAKLILPCSNIAKYTVNQVAMNELLRG